ARRVAPTHDPVTFHLVEVRLRLEVSRFELLADGAVVCGDERTGAEHVNRKAEPLVRTTDAVQHGNSPGRLAGAVEVRPRVARMADQTAVTREGYDHQVGRPSGSQGEGCSSVRLRRHEASEVGNRRGVAAARRRRLGETLG